MSANESVVDWISYHDVLCKGSIDERIVHYFEQNFVDDDPEEIDLQRKHFSGGGTDIYDIQFKGDKVLFLAPFQYAYCDDHSLEPHKIPEELIACMQQAIAFREKISALEGYQVLLLKEAGYYMCYAAKKLTLETIESAIREVSEVIAEVRKITYTALES